jgi:hypothetical protein
MKMNVHIEPDDGSIVGKTPAERYETHAARFWFKVDPQIFYEGTFPYTLSSSFPVKVGVPLFFFADVWKSDG